MNVVNKAIEHSNLGHQTSNEPFKISMDSTGSTAELMATSSSNVRCAAWLVRPSSSTSALSSSPSHPANQSGE
ncbi:hypothetical protein FF1_031205 [Malus domestica]